MNNSNINYTTITVTPFQQNARLVYNLDLGELLCIDPGGDVDILIKEVTKIFSNSKLTKSTIILTHCHIDHGGGVLDFINSISEVFKIKTELLFHEDCNPYLETIEFQANLFGLPGNYKNVPKADKYLLDNQKLDILGTKIKILFTPGHAKGHISLYFDENNLNLNPVLIAGDALFNEGIGRTDLPGGDYNELIHSIKSKLFTLPEETIVMSGHGSDTTILHEKNYNPFLR